ncbi:MAG: diaminopimelate decarboxylase [Planctomycetes bacterium]|nr:diaminopimelate decarboxylase [Planctomycetota bacterium]MCC7064960.1 diaminopimelate decarboxylase [Planctomycetota bacterium]
MPVVDRVPCPGSGASAFHLRSGELWCEDLPIRELAARFGTPLYVYSAAVLDERVQRVRAAFGPEAQICYAVKANSNLSLLQRMHGLGIGFDLVSGGELGRVQAAGLPTANCVFAGVGKESWEIEAAVQAGILFFNVESPHELPLLAAAGQRAGQRVPVALRLNPDVDAGTHAYISTAKKDNKFGVALERAGEVVAAIVANPWLRLCGYHVHLGSQLRRVEPYVQALARVGAFVDGARERSEGVTHYDLGGGFGIAYGDGEPLDVHAVAAALLPMLRARGWRPVVEPGRYLVGDAGALITAVLGEKNQGATDFVLVDAAMNDLMRPALYQAEHPIVPVVSGSGPSHVVDVVGPVCETGDFLGKRRELPHCERGDLLAVLGAGAYGASMASNYNSRRRPAEVLVEGKTARLVRRRETLAQLLSNEMDLHEA